VGEAWQCPRCSQVNAPWVPCCTCRVTYSGSTAAPVVTNPGPIVALDLAYGLGTGSLPFYVPPGSAPTHSIGGPSGQRLPEAYRAGSKEYDEVYKAFSTPHAFSECPCCRARVDAWEKIRSEAEPVGSGNRTIAEHLAALLESAELTRGEAERLMDLVESRVRGDGNPAHKEEHDVGECPNCQARWEKYRQMEEEDWAGVRSTEEEGRSEGPASSRLDVGPSEEGHLLSAGSDDAGHIHFDLGALQQRGEIAEVAPAAGRPSGWKPVEPPACTCGEEHLSAPAPLPGGTLLGGDANERPLSDGERAEEVAERLARRHVVGGAGQPTAPGEDELQDEEDRSHMVAPRYHSPECEYRLRVPGGACTCMKQCSRCGAWSNRFGPGGHDDELHPCTWLP
jgi:hypothetical protein